MVSIPETVVLWLQFLLLKQLPNDGIEFLQAVTELSHNIVDAAVRLVQRTYEEIAYLSHEVCEAEETIRLSMPCKKRKTVINYKESNTFVIHRVNTRLN